MSVIIPIPEDWKKNALIKADDYTRMYQESISDAERFWAGEAEHFHWFEKWTRVKHTSFTPPPTGGRLGGGQTCATVSNDARASEQASPHPNPPPAGEGVSIRWFEGGSTNLCYNCLDRHLPSRANQTAIIWEGDDPNQSKHITYQELYEKVCAFATHLKSLGVKKGDRVTIYLPMIPEAAVAMLATARIGAIHSVVFAGFSPEALAGRITDCGSKLVITTATGKRGGKDIPLRANVDAALKIVNDSSVKLLDISSPPTIDHQPSTCEAVPMDAEDPLFILYTSGSTGKPKGVLHTTAGYMVWVGRTFLYTFDYKAPPPAGGRLGGGQACSIDRTFPHANIRKFARTLRKEMTDAEQVIWRFIRGKQMGVKFRKQHPIGPYIADFASLEIKLIVELDGGQHSEEKNIQKDIERTEFLKSQGFEVLRFWNNEVFENLEGVLTTIFNKIHPEQASPHPNPPPAGEGADIFWCTADIGWVTGHSYTLYGPLLNGGTTLMFEGVPNYPDSSRFWQVIDKHKVTIFYTAPTAIRALMRDGDEPVKKTSRASLRLLGSVGEPINPEAWLWYHRVVGDGRCPIVDTWWQTETGGQMMTPLAGAHALKPGSAAFPMFGVKPVIVDPQGKVLEGECEGLLCIADSWPGQARTVYGDHARFEQTYFSQYAGLYFTGDGAKRDADGYYWITGRVDDVLNVSGHRIGTAEVESALVGHAHVTEAAVVGYPHDIKGQGIYCYVTLSAGVEGNEDTIKDLKNHVRKVIGPIATPDVIHFTTQLPKTRSGKIMRRILRKIAEGETENLGDISTLTNPEIVQTLLADKLSLA